MSKSKKALPVKVGDFVRIKLPFGENTFRAKVLKSGQNMGLHTIVEYEPLEDVGDRDTGLYLCNICYVVEIVEAASYVVEARKKTNIFARVNPEYYAHRINRRVRTGTLESLCIAALSSIDHIDIKNPLRDETFLTSLYEKGGCPGKIAMPANVSPFYGYGIAVNWKVFQKWVRANVLRLTLTYSEYATLVRIDEEESWKQAMDDMDEVMDRVWARA